MEQAVKIVDSRKDPDKSTIKPPPRRYAVEVIPYVCPKCRHEQSGASDYQGGRTCTTLIR
jgi:hypothetical protein